MVPYRPTLAGCQWPIFFYSINLFIKHKKAKEKEQSFNDCSLISTKV